MHHPIDQARAETERERAAREQERAAKAAALQQKDAALAEIARLKAPLHRPTDTPGA